MTTISKFGAFLDELDHLMETKENPDEWYVVSGKEVGEYSIHAAEQPDELPDDHRCYWTVNGTPRKTRFGQRIWFETDGQIVACGFIHHVNDGHIWFESLEQVDIEPPTDPPNRGFTYVDSIELPDEEEEETVA